MVALSGPLSAKLAVLYGRNPKPLLAPPRPQRQSAPLFGEWAPIASPPVPRMGCIPTFMVHPIPADVMDALDRVEFPGVPKLPPEAPPPTIAGIQAAICREFELTKGELISQRRARAFTVPRQAGMYLAKEMTGRSLPEIGRLFGHRDHTTVLHAARSIAARIEADSLFADRVERVRAQFMEIEA